MKNLLSFALALVSIGAVAAPAEVIPNLYNCQGPDKTTIGYTSTSFVGKPTFQVQFQGDAVKLAPFPEIKSAETIFGSLLTVSDMHMVPVDGPAVHYTLVLPKIVMKDSLSKEEFSTVLIRTVIGNPFFRPNVTGAVQSNQFVEVQCTAQHVLF